ncbi:MAG TPA: fumarylacetoacetate hydrolase family protein [Alphaproteobacteria bacterium]|nr:fumarylacetoacetate hydrolase family protein [Alphaproteobacteria bacterium]HJN59952.1 fumarylacetoacetate hydrolase family protein [Alphaproteobacteria bacterium]
MKLASLKGNSRDGSLIVVDRALQRAVSARALAPTLRAALDDWPALEPGLRDLAADLQAGRAAQSFALDFAALTAPLPRAAQFLDASGYLNHVELARRAAGDSLPDTLESDPLMYQGASEPLGGPRHPIHAADESWGIDFEAESAVITGAVAMGAGALEAGRGIRLIMLLNDVSARRLVPAELAKGFGFIHGKPPSACSAVALTPDELGAAWDGERLHGRIVSTLNGSLIGDPDCGVEMHFGYPELLAYAAKTRALGPGTILGSGTVSNSDRGRGSSCLLERRMIEKVDKLDRRTELMRFGDVIQIDMTDDKGGSIFGAIEQRMERMPSTPE